MLKKLIAKVTTFFRPNSSRKVFLFHDGTRWTSADPIEIWGKIETHPAYLPSKHRQMVREGSQEAIEVTAAAVCEIFGVKPYRDLGGKLLFSLAPTKVGLTIGERISLIETFFDYCEYVKKNIELGATTAHSTESM
jgi:hypothetical protein